MGDGGVDVAGEVLIDIVLLAADAGGRHGDSWGQLGVSVTAVLEGHRDAVAGVAKVDREAVGHRDGGAPVTADVDTVGAGVDCEPATWMRLEADMATRNTYVGDVDGGLSVAPITTGPGRE